MREINTLRLIRPPHIESRCEDLRRRVGAPVEAQQAKYTGGTLHELFPFFDRLEQYTTPEDYFYFMALATAAFRSPRKDTRSTVIRLAEPFEINGCLFRGLRLKGAFPWVSHGSCNVAPYYKGKGFVPISFELAAEGMNIREIDIRNNSALGPYGTMLETQFNTEIETAYALGAIADLPIGFITFENLYYFGDKVGFVVYAMEDPVDVRLFNLLKATPKSSQTIRHLGEAGSVLHVLHAELPQEEVRVHGFPHIGNFRISDYAGTKLVDLDTAMRLMSLPEEARLPLICKDLARTFDDLKDIDHSFQFFTGYLQGQVELAKKWESDMNKLRGLYQQIIRLRGAVPYKEIIERFSPDFRAWLMKNQ